MILFGDSQPGSPTQGQIWLCGAVTAHVATPADQGELVKALQQPGYTANLNGGTAQNLIKAGATPVSGSAPLSGEIKIG